MNADAELIRMPEVRKILPLPASTIYRHIRAGNFPKQVKIGRTAFWLRSEINAYLAELIAARPTTRRKGKSHDNQ